MSIDNDQQSTIKGPMSMFGGRGLIHGRWSMVIGPGHGNSYGFVDGQELLFWIERETVWTDIDFF